MKNTAMIFKSINVGGSQVAVGVIGPKRMNYSKVIGMIDRLTAGINRMLADGEGEDEYPFGGNGRGV